jgi:hypothetical protein
MTPVRSLIESRPMAGRTFAPTTESQTYTLYGLTVRSDLRLPIAAELRSAAPADVTVRCVRTPGAAPMPDGPVVWEDRCPAACHDGAVFARVHRGPGGAWIWKDGVGTCHVGPDAREVDVYPAPGADDGALGLMLLGPVSALVLQRFGTPSLHACAVLTNDGATNGRAIAFLGRPGQGKSTLAATFVRRGASLVTDDVLPLSIRDETVLGVPGPPMMKVWHETAEGALGIPDGLPSLTATLDKKLFALDGRYATARQPEPLRAIYLLDRYDPVVAGRANVEVRPIPVRDGLATLVAHTARGELLRPAEMARHLPLYARLVAQAPVRVLSYPSGFEHQQPVYERVLAELEDR